jgi:large subunit ribosomal protein L4
MKTIAVYNRQGENVGKQELNSVIFKIPFNKDLVYQAVVSQLANKRQILAHTKTRDEVKGGGRKPWRQKGTGRARHGSIRSPLWRHGGVTFGPRNERSFFKKINKKMKRKALFCALSQIADNDEIYCIEELDFKLPKTKEFLQILNNLKFDNSSKLLVVLDKKNRFLEKSVHNLDNVKVILADSLNVIDVLNSQKLLFVKKSFDILDKIYLKQK